MFQEDSQPHPLVETLFLVGILSLETHSRPLVEIRPNPAPTIWIFYLRRIFSSVL